MSVIPLQAKAYSSINEPTASAVGENTLPFDITI